MALTPEEIARIRKSVPTITPKPRAGAAVSAEQSLGTLVSQAETEQEIARKRAANPLLAPGMGRDASSLGMAPADPAQTSLRNITTQANVGDLMAMSGKLPSEAITRSTPTGPTSTNATGAQTLGAPAPTQTTADRRTEASNLWRSTAGITDPEEKRRARAELLKNYMDVTNQFGQDMLAGRRDVLDTRAPDRQSFDNFSNRIQSERESMTGTPEFNESTRSNREWMTRARRALRFGDRESRQGNIGAAMGMWQAGANIAGGVPTGVRGTEEKDRQLFAMNQQGINLGEELMTRRSTEPVGVAQPGSYAGANNAPKRTPVFSTGRVQGALGRGRFF